LGDHLVIFSDVQVGGVQDHIGERGVIEPAGEEGLYLLNIPELFSTRSSNSLPLIPATRYQLPRC
ncbi:MAG: hypothetical protein M0000_10645, partial [Actinomycetota bacterium]|nr:hypothetical protein [Actinomycetota bacterium]